MLDSNTTSIEEHKKNDEPIEPLLFHYTSDDISTNSVLILAEDFISHT